jgi:hypothetical protein
VYCVCTAKEDTILNQEIKSDSLYNIWQKISESLIICQLSE